MISSKSNEKLQPQVPQLDSIQQGFIRRAQKVNEESAANARMIRARNRFSGFFLAAVVGSIYAYTIFTVKQEKFLDELDEEPSVSAKATPH